MSDTLSSFLIIELRSKWESYTKDGFSQVDRVKLLIHDAKNFWMGGIMSQQQWGVLETVGYFYKQEDEEKFQVFKEHLEVLINPGMAIHNLTHLDEEDLEERTTRDEKWNPKDNRLLPFREWNDLWLKDFDRPTKEATK